MTKFDVTPVESERGAVLSELADTGRPRFEYDAMLKQYNRMRCDGQDVISFAYPPASMTNFSTMMRRRGLEKNVDYKARGITKDGQYHIVLKRITPEAGKLLKA